MPKNQKNGLYFSLKKFSAKNRINFAIPKKEILFRTNFLKFDFDICLVTLEVILPILRQSSISIYSLKTPWDFQGV